MQGCESVCPCPFVLKQRGVDSGHSGLLIPEIMALCEQRSIRTPSYKGFWVVGGRNSVSAEEQVLMLIIPVMQAVHEVDASKLSLVVTL
jgi:hypothetical protein